MKTRILELRPNRPIVIETPCGRITIKRSLKGRSRRHLEIDVPDGLIVSSNHERAVERAKFIGPNGEPLWGVLEPIVNDDGAVEDARPIRTARVDTSPKSFRVMGVEG